ncbi:hypothetical protein JOB18_005358 [Solea senegalensis]|uniref:Uncharacterized protein n=1 Tax=Solea senegalensis TaxID=28829 RepID=A0AAV6SEM7_SOLSE|nr:hypothetical protein JOB18_005358 [Solea senegalensis]
MYRWGALFLRKLQLSRYTNSFRAVVDVDQALRSSSLRDFEETLFCSSAQDQHQLTNNLNSRLNPRPHHTWDVAPSAAWMLGERAFPAKDWDGYWERNEPLRDADEVDVPVLCICSSDDPLLPHVNTLPIPHFQSNPYFFLALMDRGGHCGFTIEDQEKMKGESNNEEVGGGFWSHTAVLEYFRVVADFLKGEERIWVSWGDAQGEYAGQAGQRNRTSGPAPPRRRRASVMRRPRPQETGSSNQDAVEWTFTWKRSYTC